MSCPWMCPFRFAHKPAIGRHDWTGSAPFSRPLTSTGPHSRCRCVSWRFPESRLLSDPTTSREKPSVWTDATIRNTWRRSNAVEAPRHSRWFQRLDIPMLGGFLSAYCTSNLPQRDYTSPFRTRCHQRSPRSEPDRTSNPRSANTFCAPQNCRRLGTGRFPRSSYPLGTSPSASAQLRPGHQVPDILRCDRPCLLVGLSA